jgi:hypothetical protein
MKLKSTTENLVSFLALMSPSDSSHTQVDVTHVGLRCTFDLELHSIILHKACVSGLSDS